MYNRRETNHGSRTDHKKRKIDSEDQRVNFKHQSRERESKDRRSRDKSRDRGTKREGNRGRSRDRESNQDRFIDERNGTNNPRMLEETKEIRNDPREASYRGGNSRSHHNVWVFPDIVVRIVSKEYRKGKYFNKKAIVLDTPDIYHICVKIVDSGNVLEGIEIHLRIKVKILTF